MDIQDSLVAKFAGNGEVSGLPPLVSTDKWLLSSALQKLIRRGRAVQAIAVVIRLHEIEPTYLRRRLPIIAMEDIGIADLGLCVDVVAMCSSSKWWGENANHTLATLVSRLALAVKSRAACDAYCLTEAHPDRSIVLPTLLRCGSDALVDMASNSERSQLDRLTALRVLGGITLGDGTYRRLSKFNAQALDQVCQNLAMPDCLRWLVARNAKVAGMAAMLPVVSGLLDGAVVSAGQEFPCSMEMIEGLPLCSLDKYTRSGKVALQRWYAESDALQDFVRQYAPHSRPMPLINMAMFQIESCALDRSVTNPDLEEMKVITDEAELSALGLTDVAHRLPLYRLLMELAGALRRHRLDCLNLASQRKHAH